MTLDVREIGAGCFSEVFEVIGSGFTVDGKKNVADFVIKTAITGAESTDGWWDFAQWIVKQETSPYLPKIIHLDTTSKVAVLGRLAATVSQLLVRDLNGKEHPMRKDFMTKHFPMLGHDDYSAGLVYRALQAWGDYVLFSNGRREEMEAKVRELLPSDHVLGLLAFAANVLVPASREEGFYLGDLHMGNLMVDRNLNLVINDPSA
jgi:hypothetical protein